MNTGGLQSGWTRSSINKQLRAASQVYRSWLNVYIALFTGLLRLQFLVCKNEAGRSPDEAMFAHNR